MLCVIVTAGILGTILRSQEKTEETGEVMMLDENIKKSDIASTATDDGRFTNPVIFADVPDVDVIRVDDAYYMTSTTMHLSPGCPVMKSYDLVNWEIVNYVYDTLDDSDSFTLKNGQNAYGKGSWASTLRYHDGMFYVGFLSYTTGKSYIYYTTDIENGKWDRYEFNESFHDMSLLFDDDGRVYMVYGGKQIWMVELESDCSAIKEGTKRVIVENASLTEEGLGGEGAHMYKINGYYYLFLITWPENGRRTQLCYRSEQIDGPYEMKIVLDDNMGFANAGVAQGGILEASDGKWYAMLFQDHGAVGRTPVLMPVEWEDNWPVLGIDNKAPLEMEIPFPGFEKKGVVTDDEFIQSQITRSYHTLSSDNPEKQYNGSNLGLEWQWNHNPDNRYWSLTEREGYLRLRTGSLSTRLTDARNTLTQRTFGPVCSGYVSLDTTNMQDGDVAGLGALAELYGFVGVKMESGKKQLVMVRSMGEQDREAETVDIDQDVVYLKIDFDFRNAADKAYFYYSLDGENWTRIGDRLSMQYYGTHFMGYRFALFNYSTQTTGGYVDFDWFRVDDEITDLTAAV